MRIRKTPALLITASALLTAMTATAAVAATAAVRPASACTPSWKLVATPHDPVTTGSVAVTGSLGAAGQVSAVSSRDVWFPFGSFDPDYGPGYPRSWIGRWDGRAITSPAQIPGFQGTHLFGVGGSFTSATDGWMLVNTTRGSWGGLYNYPERLHGGRWTMVPLALDPRYPTTHEQALANGIAAITPDDAWTVGTTMDVTAATGSWAIGGTEIEHWNGTAWSIVGDPMRHTAGAVLTSVTAVSPRDVWAVGYRPGSGGTQQPLAEHWDGTRWTVSSVPSVPASAPLSGLFSVSVRDGQVWATGFEGVPGSEGRLLVERYNGSSWTQVSTPSSVLVSYGAESVYAAARNNVWVTSASQLWHWDGKTWTVSRAPGLPEPGLQYDYTGIGGTGPDDIWVAGGVTDLGQPDSTRNVTEAIAHYSC